VLGFIGSLAVDGVASTDRVAEIVLFINNRSAESHEIGLRNRLQMITSRIDRDTSLDFIEDGSWKLYPILIVSVLAFMALAAQRIFSPIDLMVSNLVVARSFIPVIQAVIPLMMPSTLFGRWRDNAYREKLRWDAFRHFLSDSDRIKEKSHWEERRWWD